MKRQGIVSFIVVSTVAIFAQAALAGSLYDIGTIAAPTNAKQMIYSSTYNTLVIKNSASAIIAVNATTGAVESTRLANTQFTQMSMTPSGRYIYAADYGGENIGYGTPSGTSYVQRYDLLSNSWETKSAYIAGGIAAISDNQFVLKSNDQWVTFTNDSWSGSHFSVTPLNTPSCCWGPGYYAGVYEGSIVYDPTGNRILHGNSGSSSDELQAFKLSGNEFVKQEGSGTYGSAQGYGGIVALATDNSALYYGRLQVDPLDVSHDVRVFAENIFAATGDLAFGNGDYYDAHTGDLLGSLGFNTTVYGIDQSGDKIWAFNPVDNTIHLYSTVSPVPLPAAAWLMGSGLLGLLGMSRVKRRKAK